jgi:hypothetical protein
LILKYISGFIRFKNNHHFEENFIMSEINDFTIAAPRPLPVIILADVSGSMSENGKIGVLNKSIKEMILSFSDAASSRVEIQVAVITFGGECARLHQDLISVNQCIWTDMVANGKTPMGSAFRLVAELIENKEKISSRACIIKLKIQTLTGNLIEIEVPSTMSKYEVRDWIEEVSNIAYRKDHFERKNIGL